MIKWSKKKQQKQELTDNDFGNQADTYKSYQLF